MADRKLSVSTALTTPDDADLGMIVDVSDTTDAASGTNKKITWANIKATLKSYFDTLYAAVSHTHAQSDITNLTSDLAGKASSSHTHAQSDVTNLTSDLAAKVVGPASATDNELPRYDGTTGKLIQGSGIVVADNGYVQLTGSLDTPGALVSDTISEHTAAAGVTIDGVLLKDSEVTVADEAYGSGWNGSTEVPTKNALYDKIETIGGSVTVEDENLIIGMRFFGF